MLITGCGCVTDQATSERIPPQKGRIRHEHHDDQRPIQTASRRRGRAARRCDPRSISPNRNQARVRLRRVRRMHGAARRHTRRKLSVAGTSGGGEGVDHGRRRRRHKSAPDPKSLYGARRAPSAGTPIPTGNGFTIGPKASTSGATASKAPRKAADIDAASALPQDTGSISGNLGPASNSPSRAAALLQAPACRISAPARAA